MEATRSLCRFGRIETRILDVKSSSNHAPSCPSSSPFARGLLEARSTPGILVTDEETTGRRCVDRFNPSLRVMATCLRCGVCHRTIATILSSSFAFSFIIYFLIFLNMRVRVSSTSIYSIFRIRIFFSFFFWNIYFISGLLCSSTMFCHLPLLTVFRIRFFFHIFPKHIYFISGLLCALQRKNVFCHPLEVGWQLIGRSCFRPSRLSDALGRWDFFTRFVKIFFV